jgi:hypothetical protein
MGYVGKHVPSDKYKGLNNWNIRNWKKILTFNDAGCWMLDTGCWMLDA